MYTEKRPYGSVFVFWGFSSLWEGSVVVTSLPQGFPLLELYYSYTSASSGIRMECGCWTKTELCQSALKKAAEYTVTDAEKFLHI